MRILFVNPAYRRFLRQEIKIFPLGLEYLATSLNRLKDVETRILDLELSNDRNEIINFYDTFLETQFLNERINDETHKVYQDLIEVLEDFQPDIVAISILTNKILSASKIAKIIKKVLKKVIICAGGVYPTIAPEDFKDYHEFDFIFSGESEQTFYEFIKNFNETNKRNIIIENNNEIDINEIKYPLRNNVISKYSISSDYYSGILLSRGCPFNCSYCNSPLIWKTKKIRYRNIENIIAELEYLKTNFQIKHFYLWDDNIFLNKAYLEKFCEELKKSELKLTWSGQLRIEKIDRDILNILTEAGCNEIYLGIESGSANIQKNINKKFNLQVLQEKIEIIKEYPIIIGCYFIMGFPEEEISDLFNTYNLMQSINPDDAQLNLFNVLPKTGYYYKYFANKKINWANHSQQHLSNYIFSKFSKEEYEEKMLYFAKKFDEHNESKKKEKILKRYNFANQFGFELDNITIYNLASLFEQENNFDKALTNFKKLLDTNFKTDGVNYHLASIYFKQQNKTLANQYLNKCLEINPNFTVATKLKEELNK